MDQHPLPKPEELFATLTGGEQFTKMDLSQAYLQLELEEESKRLVTINTHKGLYRFTRLPFGVASAPAIFQRVMESVLLGIPRVVCYLDDILITGASVAEHLRNVERVPRQLRTFGIQAKENKCAFLKESLGHIVDKKGLHTSPRKVEAILQAPVPQNKKELRSFLGLVHYYGKFIPNLSSLLSPLNDLLKEDHQWRWCLDKELEDLVGGCLECQSHKHTPSVAPLHPWIWPTRPWRRIHVDFAGPFLNKMFLVCPFEMVRGNTHVVHYSCEDH